MKPVLIYVEEGCKYAARARQLLMANGALFHEKDITYAEDLRREMIERSGQKTTPQIFIGDEHIGGYDDLQKLEQSGELAKKLSWTGNPDDLRSSHV